jgi:release factor glutamine methyltransferase
MTIKEYYTQFLSSLKKIYSDNEAVSIIEMVFESTLQLDRTALRAFTDKAISKVDSAKLNSILDQLVIHTPVQYVLGEAWFYKMKLKVSPAVLIPRPETEELVLEVIQYAKENTAKNILDIGTGSGCIAIAIKKHVPNLVSTAIDISREALFIAMQNAATQNTHIEFLQINFLEETTHKNLSLFDIIISNPPYIPANEKELMDKNVTAYEPHTALFVADATPLIFYEKIALFGKTHLSKTGKIFLETHENFAKAVATLFEANGYKATIKQDLSGKERMVMATHCR